MDERVQRAIDEFAKRVKQVYPDATTEVQDYKWSTEDVYIDVGIPPWRMRKKRIKSKKWYLT